ncbi:hypothetical protein PUN28_007405 [Cardiocondyla obscurior]|uniref:Uncharacterized protein n=1 Tax=Cardiocondyla obscurior TaxID=286306 RepID=A0AAW2G3P4_9HYME
MFVSKFYFKSLKQCLRVHNIYIVISIYYTIYRFFNKQINYHISNDISTHSCSRIRLLSSHGKLKFIMVPKKSQNATSRRR